MRKLPILSGSKALLIAGPFTWVATTGPDHRNYVVLASVERAICYESPTVHAFMMPCQVTHLERFAPGGVR
ncbi:hypothetical protein BDR03DRAFT_938039 [Suillus americanus]|nr:hypothetical protein BDR03DRAFT_938039 [Suillus americanus]